MVFAALSGVQGAVYHARQRFLWVELAPLLTGALGWFRSSCSCLKYGVEAAAWIATLRFVFQTVLQNARHGALDDAGSEKAVRFKTRGSVSSHCSGVRLITKPIP